MSFSHLDVSHSTLTLTLLYLFDLIHSYYLHFSRNFHLTLMVESSLPLAGVSRHLGDQISPAADTDSSSSISVHLECNGCNTYLDQQKHVLKSATLTRTKKESVENVLPIFLSMGAHFSGTQRTKGRSHPVTVVIHVIIDCFVFFLPII